LWVFESIVRLFEAMNMFYVFRVFFLGSKYG
jgi:hypothetical protein